ncbi:hypothetical protein AgCh_006994 [Apium graveolens]
MEVSLEQERRARVAEEQRLAALELQERIISLPYSMSRAYQRRARRLAAERAMAATAYNSKAVLSICIAYTSTDEILHAVQESCEEKRDEINVLEASGSGYGLFGLNSIGKEHEERLIDVRDVEKYMYVTPDPDIIIRTSGETRLSNFLLWQSSFCHLYSPLVLWPEIRFWHLVWAVLDFQRNYLYFEE